MKQFIRNFKKQQTVGILNICSLSLGIMVSIVVGLIAIIITLFTTGYQTWKVAKSNPVMQ